MTQEPEAAVVQWGDERPDPFTVAISPALLRRYVAYPLAALAAVAAFVSLLSDWRTASVEDETPGFGGSDFSFDVGVGGIGAWGSGWVVGVLALAAGVWLALSGDGAARRHGRRFGLAAAVALFAFLVAAAVRLSGDAVLTIGDMILFGGELEYAHELRPGIHAAFAAVVLAGAALWLTPDGRGPGAPATSGSGDGGERAGPAAGGAGWWWPWRRSRHVPGAVDSGPADLTVTPAEPFRDGGR